MKIVMAVATLALWAGFACAQERFGLDALLGIELGTSLDNAVHIALDRGYAPDPEAAHRQASAAHVEYDVASYDTTITGYDVATTVDDNLGLVITSAKVPSQYGMSYVAFEADAYLVRYEEELTIHLFIGARADSGASPGTYGEGPVHAVTLVHDYSEPPNLRAIEARLREQAVAPPTCEGGPYAFSMQWLLRSDGNPLEPEGDAECDTIRPLGMMTTPRQALNQIFEGEVQNWPDVNILNVVFPRENASAEVLLSRFDTSAFRQSFRARAASAGTNGSDSVDF